MFSYSGKKFRIDPITVGGVVIESKEIWNPILKFQFRYRMVPYE